MGFTKTFNNSKAHRIYLSISNSTTMIADKIYDYYDDNSYGLVFFEAIKTFIITTSGPQ